MNKLIQIPLHFNGDVTKSDIGTNLKGHVVLGTTKISLQKSCLCGLEVLIFFFLIIIYCMKQGKKSPNSKKNQQPFCTLPSTWIIFLA